MEKQIYININTEGKKYEKNRSSIHSENGIDGFREIKYAEGTQAEVYYPVCQENV